MAKPLYLFSADELLIVLFLGGFDDILDDRIVLFRLFFVGASALALVATLTAFVHAVALVTATVVGKLVAKVIDLVAELVEVCCKFV